MEPCFRLLVHPSLCSQQPAFQRAEAMYRQCLAVNSEHSYALYNLAVLKEETTKNGDYSEVKANVVVNCGHKVVLNWFSWKPRDLLTFGHASLEVGTVKGTGRLLSSSWVRKCVDKGYFMCHKFTFTVDEGKEQRLNHSREQHTLPHPHRARRVLMQVFSVLAIQLCYRTTQLC